MNRHKEMFQYVYITQMFETDTKNERKNKFLFFFLIYQTVLCHEGSEIKRQV
jgi:hypothetical protein